MSARKQSSVLPPDILENVRKAINVSKIDLYSAMEMIVSLIDKDRNIGLLYRLEAEFLFFLYQHTHDKECLTLAIKSAQISTQLTPNSIGFKCFLGYLLLRAATDTNGVIKAIQELTRAILIKKPDDPVQETPLTHSEIAIQLQVTTLQSRIKQERECVVRNAGYCMQLLKKLRTDKLIREKSLHDLKKNLTHEEKVILYWDSMHVFFNPSPPIHCEVGVNDLLSYLTLYKQYSEMEVLSQALACFQIHKTWNFWDCFDCNQKFRTSALHFDHICNVHMELSFSKLVKILYNPQKVSDWSSILTVEPWVPLDTSVAIKMSQTMKNNIWTSEVFQRGTPASFSNADQKPELAQDFDFHRADLLRQIKSTLEVLLRRGCLLSIHIDILIQQALSKLDGRISGLLKRFIDQSQSHHSLCLLNAAQLEETLDLLTKLSDFTISISEEDSFLEETLGSDKINEDIFLKVDSDILYLYKGSYSNNLTEWRDLRAKRTDNGKQELVNFEKLLSKSLKEFSELKKGLSVDILSTDVSELIVAKNKASALQNPESDSSIEGTIYTKSEKIDSELNKSDQWILRLAMDVLHLENKIKSFAKCTYQHIVLSILDSYLKEFRSQKKEFYSAAGAEDLEEQFKSYPWKKPSLLVREISEGKIETTHNY